MANRFATDPQIEEESTQDGQIFMESVYFRNSKKVPFPTYRYKEYPKVKYHAQKEPITVIDAEDEAELGKDWTDAPVRQQDGDTRQPQRRQK